MRSPFPTVLARIALAVLVLAVMAGCTPAERTISGLGTPVPAKASPTPTASPSIYIPTSPLPPKPDPLPSPSGTVPLPPPVPFPTDSQATGVITCGAVTTTTERGVSVQTTTKCYKVQGTSMDAIMADVERSGPNVGGVDAVASTQWQITSQYSTSDDGTTCSLSDPGASLKIVYTYPNLTTPDSAALDEWNAFLRTEVVPHEERHKTIALDGAATILRELSSVGSRSTCEQLESAADAESRRIVADTKAEQNAYDQRESHV